MNEPILREGMFARRPKSADLGDSKGIATIEGKAVDLPPPVAAKDRLR